MVLFTSYTTVVMHAWKNGQHYAWDKALRAFIHRHKVSFAMSTHMVEVVDDVTGLLEQQRHDSTVLHLMPEHLAKDVVMEVWGGCLALKKNLFGFLRDDYFEFFRQMCYKAV